MIAIQHQQIDGLDSEAVEEPTSRINSYRADALQTGRWHRRQIIRCQDVADIFAAINFARDHALTLAIAPEGDARLNTGGSSLIIDISSLTGVHARRLHRALVRCTALELEAGLRSHPH